MITFKQMEAFYWVAKLGNFEAAAGKLFMSQSAISKRIQELEESFGVLLFNRARRTATVSEKGMELLDYVAEILERRDVLIERFIAKEVFVGRFRLGVTELTAMTWLPKLIEAIRNSYPKVKIEPFVDISSTLVKNLEEDKLDFIIIPNFIKDSRFFSQKIGHVKNAWMCSPKLIQEDKILSKSDIFIYPLLTQGKGSGTGSLYGQWLNEQGYQDVQTIECASLIAQIGFAIAGLGVTYLPIDLMKGLIEQFQLCLLNTAENPPEVEYVAVYHSDKTQFFLKEVSDLALDNCDFSNRYLE